MVCVHDLRREVVICRYLRERVVLVRQSLTDKILHGLVGYLGTHSERIDHHTHRVGHFQVRTAVGDGGNADIVIVRKAREGVEYRCEG